MPLSLVLLLIGLLLTAYDVAFGRRLWQGESDTVRKRLWFAWQERKATLLGLGFLVASAIAQVADS